MLTFVSACDIISFVPSDIGSKRKAPIAQLDRAFDYESKGHRFESCWVHHEKPLTSFAPLRVFLYLFSMFNARRIAMAPFANRRAFSSCLFFYSNRLNAGRHCVAQHQPVALVRPHMLIQGKQCQTPASFIRGHHIIFGKENISRRFLPHRRTTAPYTAR